MMMTQLPQTPNPLSPEQAQLFGQLLGEISPVQQAWISGYLAATSQSAAFAAPTPAPTAERAPLTILYGSQTGNAKHLAADLAEAARRRDLDVKLVNMADYKPSQLKNEKYITIVTATYGEGEPPEGAQALHAYLASRKAPKLDGVQVAVMGLGDSSYAQFNQTAIDFEARLTALGATVITESALLDVDYDDQAQAWSKTALDKFEPELKANVAQRATNVVQMPGVAPAFVASQYTKKNPFPAEITAIQKITGRDSTKDVQHIELSLEGSGLRYQPGDALGVYFQNDGAAVDAVLAALALDPAEDVTLGETVLPLREALVQRMELTQSYPGFVEKYAAATGNSALTALSEDRAALRAYIEARQIYDIIRDHPARISAQALIDALRKMQPRLYSIASSQSEVEDEVHLTVGVVEWNAFEQAHFGGASGHLGRRAVEGDRLSVFVESNDAFRLPSDPDTPVIMVGPGTGIAPFRAFLQEREAQEAAGKNWLFFGNPHFTQDFLYQAEVLGHRASGLLTKLDVAFSRDQNQKIYVQDRIVEAGAELFDWLEEGAHLYICGDANRMAKDVHRALIKVIKMHGGLDDAAAESYLARLRENRRYQRDIY